MVCVHKSGVQFVYFLCISYGDPGRSDNISEVVFFKLVKPFRSQMEHRSIDLIEI